MLNGKVAIVTGKLAWHWRGHCQRTGLPGSRRRSQLSAGTPSRPKPSWPPSWAQGGRRSPCRRMSATWHAAQSLVKETLDRFGRLDILVNNAGTTRDMMMMMMSENDWDTVIQTNLKSAYDCSKAVLRPMVKQRSGRIINITSVSGLAGQAGQANYSASKAGMIGLTKALARESGARDITVNVVAPGFVPTALDRRADRRAKAEDHCRHAAGPLSPSPTRSLMPSLSWPVTGPLSSPGRS